MKIKLINIIFYIYFDTFTLAFSDKKINPIIKDKESNLLDYYISFNNYTAFTTNGHQIIIYEDNNPLKFNTQSYIFSPNIFICKNQNDKEFLFAYNYLYNISSHSDGIKSASIYKDIMPNCIYFGYIKKQSTKAFPFGNTPLIYQQHVISDE